MRSGDSDSHSGRHHPIVAGLMALGMGLGMCAAFSLLPGCGQQAGPAPPLTDAQRHTIEAARSAMIEERFEQVPALLASLLADDPPHAEAQFLAGYAAYELRRFGEAAERLEDALEREPRLQPLGAGLGIAYHRLGRYDEARRALQRTLAADPDAVEAHYGMGLVALDTGDATLARTHVEQALRLKPDFLEARLLEARVLEDEGRLEASLAAWQRLAAAWPSHEEVLYAQARVLQELGRDQEAAAVMARRTEVYAVQERIHALMDGIAAGQDRPDPHGEIVAYLIKLGDLREARLALRRGRARYPQDPILAALDVKLTELEAGGGPSP